MNVVAAHHDPWSLQIQTGAQADEPVAVGSAVSADHPVHSAKVSKRMQDTVSLKSLFAGAVAYVFPSLYEGFGLPVLEAMDLGTPVVASDIAVIREVAGNAALFFDPYSVPAIADAMVTVALDPALRADLRVRGLERASQFSWERTALSTLAAYDQAIQRARGLGHKGLHGMGGQSNPTQAFGPCTLP